MWYLIVSVPDLYLITFTTKGGDDFIVKSTCILTGTELIIVRIEGIELLLKTLF